MYCINVLLHSKRWLRLRIYQIKINQIHWLSHDKLLGYRTSCLSLDKHSTDEQTDFGWCLYQKSMYLQGIGCPYFERTRRVFLHSFLENAHLPQVWDMEDIVQFGKKHRVCKFHFHITFTARIALLFRITMIILCKVPRLFASRDSEVYQCIVRRALESERVVKFITTHAVALKEKS